tara:strand:+ start:2048 stop:2296 length:249 start_codon:yes stop_codon:yes gene_type:complete
MTNSVETGRRIRKAIDADMPVAIPRIASCRACGETTAVAGWIYCIEHRSGRDLAQLIEAGEHHGNWEVSRNRLGNPTWKRAQ